MKPRIELARPEDLGVLVPLVMDFHQHAGIRVDTQQRGKALTQALADNGPARILLAVDQGQVVGYAILSFGFSIEFAGRDAFVDELYVAPDRRGAGIGLQLLEEAERVAKANGVQALHLEAEHGNPRAADLYRRIGYLDHTRHLMTKRMG
jgi:ribosomal protein S18 acetylase RimI-like enzyme